MGDYYVLREGDYYVLRTNYLKKSMTCSLMYIKHSVCISVHLCIEKLWKES